MVPAVPVILDYFGGLASEIEEGCFDVYQNGEAHISVGIVPFERYA